MFQSARRINTSNQNLMMTTLFCDVLHVETPHNTAVTSIVVSTAHATVETTSSSDDYLARKRYSSIDVDGGLTIFDVSPEEAARLNKTHMSRLLRYFCTGKHWIRRNPEPRIFGRWSLVFVDQQKPLKVLLTMGYEAHLNILRKFLCTGFCTQGC